MIKIINFKLELTGRGVVNFDGDEQRNFLNEHCGTKYFNDNYKLAKKVFTKKETSKLSYVDKNGKEYFDDTDYKLKISSTSLRNAIFVNDANVQNPKICIASPILAYFVSSIQGLLRGYTAMEYGDFAITKKGALNCPCAIQKNNAVSYVELHSNSSPKENIEGKSSTSLYYTENVGDIEYETKGSISLNDIQFLSCDPFFGRIMFNPQWLEGENPLIDKMFKQHYGATPYKKGYFSSSTATLTNHLGEQGLLFNDDFVIFLIKEQVKRLLNVNIVRAEGYAATTSLKLKFNENGYKPFNEEGWIEVNLDNYEQIIDEAFASKGMFHFYEEINESDVSMTRSEINKLYIEKEEEKKNKKSKKSKKE